MHDATMSMNTQDEILVHRRLLLPLFPLPSVFSVFIPLSEAWLRKDDRIAINRDFYYSSDSYILTRYLLSRRLLISRKFLSMHCGFSFLPSYHSIHGVAQRILSQKHASSVHIEGDGGLKWFKELPITVRVITCSWKNVNQVPGVSTSSSKLVFGNSWSRRKRESAYKMGMTRGHSVAAISIGILQLLFSVALIIPSFVLSSYGHGVNTSSTPYWCGFPVSVKRFRFVTCKSVV